MASIRVLRHPCETVEDSMHVGNNVNEFQRAWIVLKFVHLSLLLQENR